MPALESNVQEIGQVSKSVETRGSSVYPRYPFISPSERSFISAQISSYVVGFSNSTVKSTTETSMVGTLRAMPVSLPFTAGITLATALAAPVDEGMMLPDPARPPRQSFFDVPCKKRKTHTSLMDHKYPHSPPSRSCASHPWQEQKTRPFSHHLPNAVSPSRLSGTRQWTHRHSRHHCLRKGSLQDRGYGTKQPCGRRSPENRHPC